MTILRRARGILGTAIIWAIAWSMVVVPPVLCGWWRREWAYDEWLTLGIIGRTVLLVAEWGGLHGLVFAILVATIATRHNPTQLTAMRFSLWGALAGMIVPVIFGTAWWWMLLPIDGPMTLAAILGSGMFGGLLGAGTFRVARPEVERRLICAQEETTDSPVEKWVSS